MEAEMIPPDDRAKARQLAEKHQKGAAYIKASESGLLCRALLSSERELGEARREMERLRGHAELERPLFSQRVKAWNALEQKMRSMASKAGAYHLGYVDGWVAARSALEPKP